LDAYKTAVFIFWVSFFANQRGCETTLRTALLAQLMTTTTGKTFIWFQENYETCAEIWNKIHQQCVKVFTNAVTAKCQQITQGFRTGGREYPGIPINDFQTALELFGDCARICIPHDEPEEMVRQPFGAKLMKIDPGLV
jgi:hypothetical protein